MAIGFIGLGNLGRAITSRLASLGEELVIYNRNKEKIKDLPYEKVETPREILDKCDVVFLCLFDSDAVKAVVIKPEGGDEKCIEDAIASCPAGCITYE